MAKVVEGDRQDWRPPLVPGAELKEELRPEMGAGLKDEQVRQYAQWGRHRELLMVKAGGLTPSCVL